MQNNALGNKKDKVKITYSNEQNLPKKEILGVGITNATKQNILEFIIKSIEKKEKSYYVVTPNPEIIVLASKDSEFRHILNNAKIASNDGIGISIAAWILGQPLVSRVTGVDLVKSLSERITDCPITVGFLGARPGVAERTSLCLREKYPKLKVAFIGEEWEKGKVILGEKYLNAKISNNTSTIDILFVAFGFPKQEFWMANNINKIPVKIMIGVGGSFDYISGKVFRAPGWVSAIGLEWLFRLFIEPWRIKRQMALIEFVWLVIKEKLKSS